MKKGYAISLVANAVLFAVLITQWKTERTPLANPPVIDKAATAVIVRQGEPRQPQAAEVDPVVIGGGWENWIEPLRAARVPTDVLAALIRADFDRRWQSRQAVLQEKYMRGEIDADGLAAAGIEHEAKLDHELQAALGAEPYRAWDMHRLLGNLNVDRAQLSVGERNTVYELERGLREVLQQAQSDKLNGTIDQATLNSREKSEQDAVAQKLRTLLGDQRAAQLQGVDDTPGNLKRGLSIEPLSAAQLNALADVQRNWDQTRSQLSELQNNTGNPAYAEAIWQAEEKCRGEFQKIAGADAFDAFLKSQDSRYTDLRRFAVSWQIQSAEIDGIFDMIGNYDAIVREYGLDAQARQADSDAAHAVLQRFQEDTERSLQQRLGNQRFAELKRNGIVP